MDDMSLLNPHSDALLPSPGRYVDLFAPRPMRDNRGMNATTDVPLAPLPAKAEPTIAFVSLG